MKDLIHICLKLKVLGCGMAFNVSDVGSKYPYFISESQMGVHIFFAASVIVVITHFLSYFDLLVPNTEYVINVLPGQSTPQHLLFK